MAFCVVLWEKSRFKADKSLSSTAFGVLFFVFDHTRAAVMMAIL